MERAIVFVGSVGVGKSTLINKLRGKEEARIGHSDDEDGTSEIARYQDPEDPSLVLIDTPGLDSNNFPAHVVEFVQQLNVPVLIVLVTSKRSTRITCKNKFEKLLGDLIPTGGKFCAIQTHSDIDVTEYTGYLRSNFPDVPSYKDSDLLSFKATFFNQEMFHLPKANVAAAVAAAAASKTVAGKRKMATTATGPPKEKKLKEVPLGIPMFVDAVPDAFKSSANKKGKFDSLCKEVMALKTAESREYQICKLMGDAHLKPFVYGVIKKRKGDHAEFESTAHRILDNKDGFAMPKFFDKHLGGLHNASLPNEQDKIGSHAKSDVVEALLELARRKRDTFAFIFIIKELFLLADMGDFISPAQLA